MLELMLKAGIPIIGVSTDDLPNFRVALQLIAKRKVVPWPTTKAGQSSLGPYLYWTYDMDHVTVEAYEKLLETENQLVVINPDKPSSLIRDAGELPTPEKMIVEYLETFVQAQDMPPVLQVLKGLSLKTSSEIVQITMARTGGLAIPEIRRTRAMMGASVQGLYPISTDLDFYSQPPELSEWLKTNQQYFLNPSIPHQLIPRGLMFSGYPGTGKSMASKAIAKHFGIPLYRLDIGTTLGKFVGESENRVHRGLSLIERESPCVMLLDEVEKIFGGHDDQGVTQRILSQLLWWLSDHHSRVLTVMTTNNLGNIPPELYRPGRIDRVINIQKLSLNQAKVFGLQVFKSLIGQEPSMKQQSQIRLALDDLNHLNLAHSEVAETVYDQIKTRGWLPALLQNNP